jgi:DNA-directed RNA polymerase specialized sigma24 family protein
MTDLVALRRSLVRLLYQQRAYEPEDGAQNILLRAWLAGTLDKPPAYFWTAARHEAADQYRQRHRKGFRTVLLAWGDLDQEDDPLVLGVDWRDDVLALADPWLLDYYAASHHTGAEKARALRSRRRLLAQVGVRA